jgi:hypothetical protein
MVIGGIGNPQARRTSLLADTTTIEQVKDVAAAAEQIMRVENSDVVRRHAVPRHGADHMIVACH